MIVLYGLRGFERNSLNIHLYVNIQMYIYPLTLQSDLRNRTTEPILIILLAKISKICHRSSIPS